MCSPFVLEFGTRCLTTEVVAGRDVIEVGAYDVNGSIRPHVEALGPRSYLGVDITPGPRVDRLIDARELVEELGPAVADVVISTEVVEHVRDWRIVIQNLKGVLRPGGHLLVTTRSRGFGYHAWPYDFWRYELDDMRSIFGDMEIRALETDPDAPGVFLFARRMTPADPITPAVSLYSMVTGRRQAAVSDAELRRYRAWTPLRTLTARVRSSPRDARRTLASWRRSFRRRVVRPVWMALPPGLRRGVKRILGRS